MKPFVHTNPLQPGVSNDQLYARTRFMDECGRFQSALTSPDYRNFLSLELPHVSTFVTVRNVFGWHAGKHLWLPAERPDTSGHYDPT
jgi:hypothetical protein